MEASMTKRPSDTYSPEQSWGALKLLFRGTFGKFVITTAFALEVLDDVDDAIGIEVYCVILDI